MKRPEHLAVNIEGTDQYRIWCCPSWIAIPGHWGTRDPDKVTCKKCLKKLARLKDKHDAARISIK